MDWPCQVLSHVGVDSLEEVEAVDFIADDELVVELGVGRTADKKRDLENLSTSPVQNAAVCSMRFQPQQMQRKASPHCRNPHMLLPRHI